MRHLLRTLQKSFNSLSPASGGSGRQNKLQNKLWLEGTEPFASSNINEGIKAVLLFKRKNWEQKVLGPNKLVKVRMYVRTFTNLLGPSEYANLLVPQK